MLRGASTDVTPTLPSAPFVGCCVMGLGLEDSWGRPGNWHSGTCTSAIKIQPHCSGNHFHRPGSLRFDDNNESTQVSSGGEDLLSDIGNFMVKYLELPTEPIPSGRPLTWLLVGLASGLWAGLILFPMCKGCLVKTKAHDAPVRAPCLKL